MLTSSRFFAKAYLNFLDHFCKQVLRAPYVSYADDFVLFAKDAATLVQWHTRIDTFLQQRRLRMQPEKTKIQTVNEPALFLDF